MSAATWAIVPVKLLGQAKRRLAPVLPANARRRLVVTMLEQVLATVGEVEAIDARLVVTPDADVAELAKRMGATVLAETRARGLNAAASAGLAHARAGGAAHAVILPADIPLATPQELRRIVEHATAGGRPRIVLAPSRDGDATNALMLSPPDALEPSFGPGSFLRHLAQAVARKLDVQVLQLPGLASDIDEPHDLERLLAHEQGAARYGFLGAHASRPAGHSQNHPRGKE